jgi:UDP:flavonoid glycosyltransferase YjiC (YdhE family)
VRVLVSFVGGRGHFQPIVPIARALAAAGHEVAVACQEAMVSAATSLGFTAHATGPSTLLTTPAPLMVPDRAHELRVVRDHFAGTIARGRHHDVLALARRWRPDVILCDEVDVGAMLAAEALGVPHAQVVVIASGTFLRPELVAESLDALRAELGLPPDPPAAMLARDLLLAPVPPSFRDPDCPLPVDALALRPEIAHFSGQPGRRSGRIGRGSGRTGRRPLVYVTLGTIFNLESGDLFARVVEGVRDLPVDVLVTVGPYLDPCSVGPQPSNVRVAPFVPQAEVLPEVDVVACHGGSGSVIGALAHGVPLLVLPMGADQPDNAARVEALGAGVQRDVMSVTPAEIAAAVDDLLRDPRYRASARAIEAECAALPGPDAAVAPIEQLTR